MQFLQGGQTVEVVSELVEQAGRWQLRQYDTQRLNGVQIAGALMVPIKDALGVSDHGESMFLSFVEYMDMTKKWNGSHRLLLSCRQVS